jgi:hypothetical protein
MDEGRKRVLGIMAAILASRKLGMAEVKKNSPAYVYAISEAVSNAEAIMERIDREWPTSISKSA